MTVRAYGQSYSDEQVDVIARVAHESCREYGRSVGDQALLPEWGELLDELRDSVRDGVRFHLQNPAAGPAASHDNWMRFRTENGWHHGRVKDVIEKTHPAMVPYHELPVAQRRKDVLFIAVVRALS